MTLQDEKAAVVRERVLAGVADLLEAGEDVTFAKVARASGVPERTVYRHFPSREALLAAVFEWANRRLGFDGARPTDGASAAAQVRRTFPGFDGMAPLVRELLLAPDGLLARLSDNERRRASARAVVAAEAPGLAAGDAERLAAVVQVLTSAAAWQTLRDYWDMDGGEAAEAVSLALRLMLAGAASKARATGTTLDKGDPK